MAGGEWLLALAASVAALGFSACVGLACSACARRPPTALAAALVISAGWGLVWPLAMHAPGVGGGLPAGPVAAPFVATLMAVNPLTPGASAAFRHAMAGMLVASGVALLVAWWALRREHFAGDGLDTPQSGRRRAGGREGFAGMVPGRGDAGRWSGTVVLGLTLLLGLVAWHAFAAGPVHLGLSLAVLAVAHVGLKLIVVAEAARLAAEDRTGGALEIFCTIPAGEVWLRQSWHDRLRRLSLGPLAGLLAVDAVLLGRGLFISGGGFAPVPWAEITVALMVLLPADVWTLSLVGLHEGVRTGSPTRAFFRALWRVLGLPLPLFIGNAAVVVALAGVLDLAVPAAVVACWVIWGLVVNVGLAARAWLALTDGLRQGAEPVTRWHLAPAPTAA